MGDMRTLAPPRIADAISFVPGVIRRRALRDSLLLCAISITASLIFYLPFWLTVPSMAGIKFDERGIETVHKAWDGPVYTTVAATLWDRDPDNPAYDWIREPV